MPDPTAQEIAEKMADVFEAYLRARLQLPEPVGWQRIEEHRHARNTLVCGLAPLIETIRAEAKR